MLPVIAIAWSDKRPQSAFIYDKDRSIKRFVPLWMPGTGLALKQVFDSENLIRSIVKKYDKAVIIDYKRFLDYFGYDDYGDIYDYPGTLRNGSQSNLVNFIISNLEEFGQQWQLLRGFAATVYYKLEKTGVTNEYRIEHPHYTLDAFTGRAKSTGFVIHSMDESYNIRHMNPNYTVFIHFDWISADFRIAAHLSDDESLVASFKDSDPYSFIEKELDNQVSRDDCKLQLLRATYSLDLDSDIFIIYPRFSSWLKECLVNLDKNKYVKSILGRKFYSDGSIDQNRRAINAIMQGSVAHAMNSVLYRVSEQCGDIILTEQHDSLTVCTRPALVAQNVKLISEIMYKPILDCNLTMPLKIHIGKHWGQYKYLRDHR